MTHLSAPTALAPTGVSRLLADLKAAATAPPGHARAPPAAGFTDPEFLALEREKLIDPGWIALAHVSQLREPGDYVAVDLLDEPLLAQVPHPAAPEFETELRAHQAWWERCWSAMAEAGLTELTMTPEFGPDGYLHHLPFTDAPVADLRLVNRWMMETEKAHFARWQSSTDNTV